MIIKLCKRYYCEFCKNAGGSSYHMKRHESGCTLNPGRVCLMCQHGGLSQKPIAELLLALKDDTIRHDAIHTDPCDMEPIEALCLRRVASNCPACILAAIRQSGGFPVKFDWRDESASFWEPINIENELHRKERLSTIVGVY